MYKILITLLLFSSCAVNKPTVSIHERLIANDCYEFDYNEQGKPEFVHILGTDACMMIAYPEKGEF